MQSLWSAGEHAGGALLVMLVLLDVFVTVLYARAGGSIFANHLARAVFAVFRWVAGRFPRRQAIILTFCGPAILVSLLGAWTSLLIVGAALLIHPNLGTSVRSDLGPTSKDLGTALYAAGTSISIVGAGSFSPHTPLFQLMYVFNSLAGASVITMTVTYLLQIYSALERRNVLGLKFHVLSGETNDPAEILARVGARGRFDQGYALVTELAAEMTDSKEAHHFYPVLFYFRFREPFYSITMSTAMALDMVALATAGLGEEYAWFKESAGLRQLGDSSMRLIRLVEETFLEGQQRSDFAEDECPALWRARYHHAVRRFREAGIATAEDEEAGARQYVQLRSKWDGHMRQLAPGMAYTLDEVDPATYGQRFEEQRVRGAAA